MKGGLSPNISFESALLKLISIFIPVMLMMMTMMHEALPEDDLTEGDRGKNPNDLNNPS